MLICHSVSDDGDGTISILNMKRCVLQESSDLLLGQVWIMLTPVHASRDTRNLHGQVSAATFISNGQLYTHRAIGTVQLLHYRSLQSPFLQHPDTNEARGLLPARYAELVLHSQALDSTTKTHQDPSRLVVRSKSPAPPLPKNCDSKMP